MDELVNITQEEMQQKVWSFTQSILTGIKSIDETIADMEDGIPANSLVDILHMLETADEAIWAVDTDLEYLE